MRPQFNSVSDLQINNTETCLILNFVINQKVISLHKEIKYMKRSKSSFDDFSAKHTLYATLKLWSTYQHIIIVMLQTSYPWNYVPMNQWNFDNPQTLALTYKFYSTLWHILHELLLYVAFEHFYIDHISRTFWLSHLLRLVENDKLNFIWVSKMLRSYK